jgi:hypothetical protein
MTFYLNLAANNIHNHQLAIAYLRRALSMANRERNRKAAGKVLKAIRLVHEARKG